MNTSSKITFSVFITEFYSLMWEMRWFMILALILISTD